MGGLFSVVPPKGEEIISVKSTALWNQAYQKKPILIRTCVRNWQKCFVKYPIRGKKEKKKWCETYPFKL